QRRARPGADPLRTRLRRELDQRPLAGQRLSSTGRLVRYTTLYGVTLFSHGARIIGAFATRINPSPTKIRPSTPSTRTAKSILLTSHGGHGRRQRDPGTLPPPRREGPGPPDRSHSAAICDPSWRPWSRDRESHSS